MQAANFLAIKHEAGADAADAAGTSNTQQQHQQQQSSSSGAGGSGGYLCPSCVHQAGDSCPLDLLQLHAALLSDMKPRRPRSAADIYAAEVTRKVGLWGWGVFVCVRDR